jgi:hypothetical protein
MVAEYRNRGHHVVPLVWSRGASEPEDPGAIVCVAKAGYGDRFKGIAARLRWMWFLASRLVRQRRSYDVIHAVDLDTSLIAVPIGRLLGKIVVYDAFDSIGAILDGGVIAKLLMAVERRWIAASSIAVFPDPIRLEQYEIVNRENVVIISNIPDPVKNPCREWATEPPVVGRPLRFVYIGTLESEHRGLEYIPGLCMRFPNAIEFIVGGVGKLHHNFLTWSAGILNLTYVGHQDYESALALMAGADCLYGPYLLSAKAHKYASPNKMYEHLMLGKPLITNIGTPPARLVQEAQSGWVFDGTFEGLRNLIEGLTLEMCLNVGLNALAKWQSDFSTLRRDQLKHFFSRLDAESMRGTHA